LADAFKAAGHFAMFLITWRVAATALMFEVAISPGGLEGLSLRFNLRAS
jgi:hypothetical protein